MLNEDEVRNSVVRLLVKWRRDGKIKGKYSRKQFRLLISKNSVCIKGMDGLRFSHKSTIPKVS